MTSRKLDAARRSAQRTVLLAAVKLWTAGQLAGAGWLVREPSAH